MRRHPLRLTPVALGSVLALAVLAVGAQPPATQLPVLNSAFKPINASVAPVTGSTMTVTQSTSASNRGVVEWNSFSIGSSAKVNIVQPNAQSVLVNRVVGDGGGKVSASEIYGAMSSNGRIFLVNPSGIVFGPGAQVNVGSLVATSLDLPASMTANNYSGLIMGDQVLLSQSVAGTGGSSLQVLAAADRKVPQIQVGEGGSITLVSRDSISQAGVLSAPKGQINLATAQTASVLPLGTSGFVQLALSQPTATPGTIALEAGSNTVAAGGSIHINAGPNGSVSAGDGVTIDASSTTAGGSGGDITLLGRTITLDPGSQGSLQLLADGPAGGGSVNVGDDNTRSLLIAPGAVLSADATQSGNGGSVIAKAMFNDASVPPTARVSFGVAEVYGELRARGGVQGGNGGHVETSGTALSTRLTNASGVSMAARVDASARAPGGQAGTWTLDPYDVTISNGLPANVDGSFNPTGPGANVQASDLSAALNAGTNVDISTSAGGAGTAAGDITITADTVITRSSGTAPASLTLRANNNIIMGAAFIDASKAGPVNVSFYSDIDGNGSGYIAVQGSQIATGGGSLTLSGGAKPATDFASGDSQNAGVSLRGSTIDTRGNVVAGVGDVVIRGQAGATSNSPGVDMAGTLFVGNLSVAGLSSHGVAVALSGADISTAAGNIDIRGVSTRSDAATALTLTGVDATSTKVQLGTGSLTLAGRGDDANLVANGSATGLLLGDLQISAAAGSKGRVALAGQSTGGSKGHGIDSLAGGNSGLVISTNALTSGSPATGASVVIGGAADAPTGAINLTSFIGPNIATTASVNFRPLGVSSGGAITEQVATPIAIAPAAAASGASGFNISADWLRPPLPSSGGGISAGQGFVIGSAAQTGQITVADNALTQHATVAITLQNEGSGSQGILLGSGITLHDLGLLTAGNVTQNPGGINVANLVIRGGASSNVALNDAANQIGVLAFDPPAVLSVVASSPLTVDAASIQTFDATGGSFTPLAITNSSAGNTALLQSAGDVTLNRSITMTGSGASTLDIVSGTQVVFATGANLSTSAAGRWRVWAPAVVNAPGTAPKQNLYGCLFGDTTTCEVSGAPISPSGNQVLFPNQPTVTVTATPTTAYAGVPLPPLGFTTSGLVNGDTAAAALSGALGSTSTTSSPPGSYAITPGTLTSPTGYKVVFQSSTLTLNFGSLDILGVNRQMLQSTFNTEISSDVYGRNLAQPYVCSAASLMHGTLADDSQTDPLSSEWGKVRNQPQLSGCLNVNDGGQCSAF